MYEQRTRGAQVCNYAYLKMYNCWIESHITHSPLLHIIPRAQSQSILVSVSPLTDDLLGRDGRPWTGKFDLFIEFQSSNWPQTDGA